MIFSAPFVMLLVTCIVPGIAFVGGWNLVKKVI